MADLDVGIRRAALADAAEKIVVMCPQIRRAPHLLPQLVARAVQLPATVLAQKHDAVRAVKGVPVLISLLDVRCPDALLENKLARFAGRGVRPVLEQDILRVGKLLVVVEEIFPAQRGDAVRVRRDTEPPAGDIEVVHAVVAHVAGAERVPPAPNAVQHV